MRFFLTAPLFLLLFHSNCYGQIKKVKQLGDVITKALMESDTATFYAQTPSVDLAIEIMRPQLEEELDKEELEAFIQNVREYYPLVIEQDYGASFLLIRNKIEIFDLKLEDIKYEILEMQPIPETEDLIPVLGHVPHEKWKYLCFYAMELEGKLYLATSFIQLSETNLFEEVEKLSAFELSAGDEGMLQAVGRIELDYPGSTPSEVRDCIMDGIVLAGIEESSREVEAAGDYEFIRGAWDYGYYVNDIEEYVGSIAYNFEFKIFEDHISYEFSDFVHSQGSGERQALGRLPYEANDQISEVFTEIEWEEIMEQIHSNTVAAIRRANKTLDGCFE